MNRPGFDQNASRQGFQETTTSVRLVDEMPSRDLGVETTWIKGQERACHRIYYLSSVAGDYRRVKETFMYAGTHHDVISVRGLFEAHHATVDDVRAGRLLWWRHHPEAEEGGSDNVLDVWLRSFA